MERTSSPLNRFEQPVGVSLPDWTPRALPEPGLLQGQYCRLEHFDAAKHGDSLLQAYAGSDAREWTYLPVGPFANEAAWREHFVHMSASRDPLHFAIVDQHTGLAVGSVSLMRQDPVNGCIEVGYVQYSPRLKQSRLATEAQYLLMAYAIGELGYRRYEWKCDALNAPSRAAAQRLGFQFEGIFRQAIIYKGRTRDTAWFSLLDSEWPSLSVVLQQWLAADNFDSKGQQRASLSTLTRIWRAQREAAE